VFLPNFSTTGCV